MAFRVTARTVLQLGAELISSDAVAFYELIKNAFDANSRRVDIDVVVRLPHEHYLRHRDLIQAKIDHGTNKNCKAYSSLKEDILADVDATAPKSKELTSLISAAANWLELISALDDANYINITDTGTGMSADDLKRVYLTIGTCNRQKQRADGIKNGKILDRPVLGDKGLGRLSAMRLGNKLRVETTVAGEKIWNLLQIDWRRFTNDTDVMIEAIDITPEVGHKKVDSSMHGTHIHITSLASAWSSDRLRAIAIDEFSKLQDPFAPRSDYRISLRYNDEPVPIPAINKLLFEHAHAYVEASYTIKDGAPRLVGRIDYRQRRRQKTFEVTGSTLLGITNSSRMASLLALGPFSMCLYWFNRQILTSLGGIGDRQTVQRLQARWAGGLMVFRDGFRVHPYGNPEDDWIGLDRRALASAGFKVNRQQIIGKVDITSADNPRLMDQTNREGLRDCEEKRILVALLKHVLEGQFRVFLNVVDSEIRARIPVSFDDLEDRVKTEEHAIRQSLKGLIQKHPEVKQDTHILSAVTDSTRSLRELIGQVKELSASYDKGHNQLVYLAGLGLMVEILAHELNRATQHTLATLSSASRDNLPRSIAGTFATLESQLRTLQKRLKILDPLSTPGRQRKEKFELVGWVEEILQSHAAQFQRHGIVCRLETRPSGKHSELNVNMVKGMMVQVLENLLSNSVYWLKQEQKLIPSFTPTIIVVVDTKARCVMVTDNGPGVPTEEKEYIFQPFVTTKPPGEGKGLGLYISREIAEFHGAKIEMSGEESVHSGRLNTFVLSLPET